MHAVMMAVRKRTVTRLYQRPGERRGCADTCRSPSGRITGRSTLKLPFATQETSAARDPCEGAPGIRTSVTYPLPGRGAMSARCLIN